MNPKADFYFNNEGPWQKAITELRKIALDCQLEEELKWGCPCYTYQKKNIVLIHVFKEYCALLFFKGALMKDPNNILIQQTENVQAGRQIRFTSLKEVTAQKAALKKYIFNAVEVEESGEKVPLKKTREFEMPEELQKKLDEDAALKKAFEALTPGRQRGYLLYFAQAKQSKTREARIEKSRQDIFDGKGWNE